MKKTILVLTLCLLVIALSACGAAKKETSQPFSGSIMDLLKLGRSAKCVLVAKTGADITTGTTYITGNKARSDYEMKGQDNKTIKGHYISDGTWMYTWTETTPAQAIKMKLDQIPNAQPEASAGAAKVSDLQDKMDYNCYPWVVDQSLFNPPAGVNFIDYSQLLNQLQNIGQGQNTLPSAGNSAMCAQCD